MLESGMIYAVAVVLLGAFGLIGFVIQRLYKLAENALVLARAKDAEDYVHALEQVKTAELAKPVPKQENKPEEPETVSVQMPDGTVRELAPVWVRD